ncbi:hypothetical protein EIN_065770, partial [Entamoeba invadens IP1]
MSQEKVKIPFEQKKIFDKMYSKFWQMNLREKIISPDDKIIIGFSGGKDSLLLLHILSTLMKNKKYNIKVLAIHVKNDEVGYHLDADFSRKLCEDLNVPFLVLDSERVAPKDIEDSDKTTFCLSCGKNRRRALLKYAKENGYTSIALGHHMDDVAETLLLNQMFCGCIAGIPSQFVAKKYNVKFIRPLIDIPVVLIQQWTHYITLPILIRCNHESDSMRGEVRELLENLKKKHPFIVQSIAQ